MNKWMFLFSLFGIFGAVLVAAQIVAPGYVFWLISDVGMIIAIMATKTAKEQLPMWVIYTAISLIGLLSWTSLIHII